MNLDRKDSYTYEDLLSCGHGELFGPENARLPLPPMLMIHRIPEISEEGGEFGFNFGFNRLDCKIQRCVAFVVTSLNRNRSVEPGFRTEHH